MFGALSSTILIRLFFFNDSTGQNTLLIRIMTLKIPNEIWEFLKQMYDGNEKVKAMQALDLVQEFEMQRMKESKTIKELTGFLTQSTM